MLEKFPALMVRETDFATMASKLQMTLLDIVLVRPLSKVTARTCVGLRDFLSSFFRSA